MPAITDHDTRVPPNNNRSEYKFWFFLMLAVVVFVILLLSLVAAVFNGRFRGVNSVIEKITGQSYECSGTASVPEQYMPWVKEAAKTHLNGDEAALIALIQTESGWRANAKAGSSSATGLGQFIAGTARGFKEFVGGNDGHGTNWPAPPGQTSANPLGNPDARLDPKRSIFATAHLLSGMIQRYGSVGAAYEYGYHTHGNGSSAIIAAAQKARARLEQIYNNIRSGCILGGAGFAKASGEFCPPLGSHQSSADYNQHGNGLSGVFGSTLHFPRRSNGAVDWGQACNCGRPGFPVYATFNGTVSKVDYDYTSRTGGNKRAGDIVNIVSDDRKHEAVYAHIDASVANGAKVSKCQQIGIVAGRPKTMIDPHLHFQFWHNGKGLSSQQLYEFFKPSDS